MSWRPSEQPPPEEGLSLRRVLEHYGVSLRGRDKQNVHCPLHEDRTPSCSVDLEENVWNCHSCGQSGGALKMLALKEGVPIGRARHLATTLGLSAGEPGDGGQEVRSPYLGGGTVSVRKRAHAGHGGYVPAWRRN